MAITAVAGQVLQGKVELADGHYRLDFDVLIHAASPEVRALLTDYAGLIRVNPAIKQVVMLPAEDVASQRMRVLTRTCVLFFCRNLTHVQEVHEAADGGLVAEFLPQLSDFRYGRMTWHILPAGCQTRLQLQGDLVPAFWVPPLIGPLVIKHKLRQEALETARAVERLAARTP